MRTRAQRVQRAGSVHWLAFRTVGTPAESTAREARTRPRHVRIGEYQANIGRTAGFGRACVKAKLERCGTGGDARRARAGARWQASFPMAIKTAVIVQAALGGG